MKNYLIYTKSIYFTEKNFHLKNEIVENLLRFLKNNYKTTFLKQDDLLKILRY